MRVIAAITEPKVAKRILECVGLPPRASPLEPARTSGVSSGAWLDESEASVFVHVCLQTWDCARNPTFLKGAYTID